MPPTSEYTDEPAQPVAPTGTGSAPVLEAELAAFEAAERERLGLPAAQRQQWVETMHNTFTTTQRKHTTLLVSGLTQAHDFFLEASLKGIGYRVQRIDCPDNESLCIGKEFGNRGLCNPSYYTVGNLLKFLHHLEEDLGLTKSEIIERYLLITANGCGPCRFGMYLTEYRKALRDSGFEGFRVLLFGQTIGRQEVGEGGGLECDTKLIIALLKAVMLGDILNLLAYRIRPYEIIRGATDAVVERCKSAIYNTLEQRRWLLPVLWRARRELAAIPVERDRVKPRVSLIGEFWAMTTEGEGNYRMQRFLEAEGAEVKIQPLSTWLLLLIWVARHDMRLREGLRGVDATDQGIAGVDLPRLMRLTWLIEKTGRISFAFFARALGLRGYRLPNMEALAEAAQPYYDTFNRGGEAHMEVAELLHNVAHNSVNMTVSVKPFSCMPSSGISDGVQSYVTEKYPRAIFLPVETTGDCAVSVYSRLQMQLFKARRMASEESATALARYRLREDEAREWLRAHPRFNQSLYHAPRRYGCTAADLFEQIGRRKWVGLWRIAAPLLRPQAG